MGSSSRQPSDIGSSASPSTSSESAATASVPPPAGDALARWREQVRWQQPLPEDAAPLPRRYSHYVHNILYRELLLKGSPNKWADVPQLSAITVRLLAREQKFSGGREAVERWEMLLHRVALEYMAGTSTTFTPAADLGGEYAQEPREGGRVAGVEATLTGPLMWAFLEKLVVLVLPAQIGFEGIPPPQVVPNPPPFAPRASNRRPPIIYQPRPTAWRTAFRVGNVLAFPDLEENFDLWQGLGALQVELAVEGTTQPQLAELLLHGLALPTLEGDAAALALSGGANLTAGESGLCRLFSSDCRFSGFTAAHVAHEAAPDKARRRAQQIVSTSAVPPPNLPSLIVIVMITNKQMAACVLTRG